MRNNHVIVLAECALAVALAVVLNLLVIRLPINIAGGSISLTMLPIAIVAIRRGSAAGAAAGLLFGTLDLFIGPYMVHWVQVILDYPLPYMLFGLGVGLFSRWHAKIADGITSWSQSAKTGAVPGSQAGVTPESQPAETLGSFVGKFVGKGSALLVAAVIAGGILRYFTHVVSGVIFFAEAAEGGNVWLYSLGYNITYLAPSLAATIVLALIIVPVLIRAVPINKNDTP